MDYKKAGVDIEAGYKSVELMKKHVKATMRPEVLGGIGGFAGAFDLSKIKDMEEPVLLSGTDGCGTKVKLAFVMDKHDTMILLVQVENLYSSLITLHVVRIILKRLRLSLRVLLKDVFSLNVPLLVVKLQNIQV